MLIMRKCVLCHVEWPTGVGMCCGRYVEMCVEICKGISRGISRRISRRINRE